MSLAGMSGAAAQAASLPTTAQIDTRLTGSRGALSISDSLGGRAVLNAANLAPGGSASGTVSLLNRGTARGSLTLAAANLASPEGPGGGSLADELRLRIDDQTAGGATVFEGPLDSLRGLLLGGVARGQRRTYRFTVTLSPQAGNEYAGAAARMDLVWDATVVRSTEPFHRAAMQAAHPFIERARQPSPAPLGFRPPPAPRTAPPARPCP